MLDNGDRHAQVLKSAQIIVNRSQAGSISAQHQTYTTDANGNLQAANNGSGNVQSPFCITVSNGINGSMSLPTSGPLQITSSGNEALQVLQLPKQTGNISFSGQGSQSMAMQVRFCLPHVFIVAVDLLFILAHMSNVICMSCKVASTAAVESMASVYKHELFVALAGWQWC